MKSQILNSTARLSFALVAALLSGASATCKAYVYSKVDFKARAAKSTDIVIGTVAAVSDGTCAFQSRCANVEIIGVAKGAVKSKEIKVLFDGPIAEFSPHCCQVGVTYLFFLLPVANSNYYESGDGPFGIYRLGTNKADEGN